MKPCPVRIVAACPGGALRAVGHTVEVPRRGSVHPMKPRRWPVVFPLRRKRTGARRRGAASQCVSMPTLASPRPAAAAARDDGLPGRRLGYEPGGGRYGLTFAAVESKRAAGLCCVRCYVLAAIVCLPRKRWKTGITRGPPGHSRSGRAAVRDTTESTRPLSYCGLSARPRTRKRSKREYARARLRGNRAASPSP